MKLQLHTMLISILLSAGLLAQSISPAFALVANTVPATQATTPATQKNLGAGKLVQDVNRLATQASHAATVAQSRLTSIIARADTMITTRVTSLQTLLTRVQNDQRLSSDERTSLASDIQTQITSLQTLKTKIDADTDATTALADSKDIITNYYVYAVYEPKTQLLVTLNNLNTVISNVQKMVPQLQNLITTYGTGKDTTQLQGLLNDISTQLSTMSTTITSDITTVEGVSISSPTTAKTTFTKIRGDITTVYKTGLTKVRSDFVQMRPLFKTLLTPPSGTSASSSASSGTVVSVPSITAPIVSTQTAVPTVNPH